ncbi:MAG TPA: polysaccharide deacetylase family protein [Bradyrhizobium sp.]|jgi:peptidoglycan/xylan/chitin deacetylase (PgdA/CDA1 family)|nr:polysaccharide deacetylase family protein [Bradyrhizobium sp.]
MAGFLAPDIAGRVSQHMKLTSASVLIAIAWIAGAQAAECPRPGTLGTSRVLSVDAASTPRVGLKSFPQTLPLAEHEVVLTFDDGPWPATTSRVLATLAQECVRATFFMIGKNAAEHPNLVRRIADEGHTIGHHTWSHRSQMRIKPGETTAEIDRGISAVEMALHGNATTTPTTPFFRFPGFESTPATLALLQSRGIVVFGADLWASDWNPMAPKQELTLIAARLKAAGKGIILFHDTKAQTAAMLAAFLRYLKDNGYHVVHVTGASLDSAKAP